MNRKVYFYLFQTYGQSVFYWAGVVAEIIRSLMVRVWVVIIMAHVASNIAERQFAAAKQDIVYFLIVYIAGSLIGAAGELMAVTFENRKYAELATEYSIKLSGKDMSFYRDNQGGYLVSLYRQYLDSSLILVRFFRGDIVRAVIGLGMPAVVLAVINWRLGLVAAAVVATQVVYIIWSSAKSNKWRELSHEIYRRLTAEVADTITNITAYKSSGVEQRVRERVEQLAREEAETFWQRHKTNTILDLPRDTITALGITTALLVIVAANQANPSQSIGLIVLTVTYMFQIVRTVSDLPKLVMQHDDYLTKLYPTLAYLESTNETIKNPEHPKRLHIRDGSIEIVNVTFSYPSLGDETKRVSVFKGLTMHLSGGEQVGIVGLSGAGKSTLANLLMRFDDVDSGAILIDGINIKSIRQDELRQNIAYVPQEPLLFHRSIRENIAYFNAAADDATITRAARAAHAQTFIEELPDGYQSMVGERGVKLSGGQKQRIVIARAILKNAPIMIFDEATSALDSESEKIIQLALPEILGRRTAVVIAHRLSTVAPLDRIYVMHYGQIIEEGTHDQLLALGGKYASLWKRQIMDSSEA